MAGSTVLNRFDWKSLAYSLAYPTGVGELTAAEICDAIKNATTTAGTLISLKT
jgi:hypothetical protein